MDDKTYAIVKVVLICKEFVNGEAFVYVKNENMNLLNLPIKQLELRQRYNPEQQFFVMKKELYDNETTREYAFGLIEKGISSDLYTYV